LEDALPSSVKATLVNEVFPRLESLESQGNLVTTIVVTLAQEIIEGVLQPGFELTSVDLGKRFNTSRTPVREALAILQREGLVDVRTRLRPRVAKISRKEIHDLYLVRASLYSLVSQEIVRHSSDEEIAQLLVPLEAMAHAVREADLDEYFAQSVQFRHLESNICHNDLVGGLIDSLGLRVYRLRRFGLSLPGRLRNSLEDHRHLYEAYVERDEHLACAVTESLVLRALHAIEENLKSEE
jgi:DNA-binding GntR family transcriptional regulator